MRGRSNSARARLRSAGYKCNLCGRRVIDAVTLERHQKTVHNISTRVNKVSFKPKPVQMMKRKPSNKEDKIFTNLPKEKEHIVEYSRPKRIRSSKNESVDTPVKESAVQGKIISDKKIDLIENGENVSAEKEDSSKKKVKNLSKEIHFVCPACQKVFSVYFNAHKHIQREHSDMSNIRPIRVEPCLRCNCKIRSDEAHKCRNIIEDHLSDVVEYICSGCSQGFPNLKSFDMHVAGLHSDAVDSMFFPSKLEFVTWRLEMERQTNSKYLLYGEYESKKVYRCKYARNDTVPSNYIAYFCPSSIVVQEFAKGIQVHFYHKHYDHTVVQYMLSSKYQKYSITSFLKSPTESPVASAAGSVKLDDKELFSQFKNLMDGIVTNAAEVDPSLLKILIDKALEMSAIVTDAADREAASTLKSDKNMSDKEITEALETNTDVNKRRKSVDSCEISPKPAKRIRNKSLFIQSPTKLSPKIVNTFSLASSSNSEEFRSDYGDDIEFDPKSDNNDELKCNLNKNAPESDIITSKSTKMHTRLSSASESLSFNDSYKDFIDRNFIANTDSKSEKSTKNKVKTKLGAFKQISPRRVENKEDKSDMCVVNRGIKPIPLNKSKIDEAPKKIDAETPKLNILSIETPNLAINKSSSSKADAANTQISNSKVDLKNKGFSHVVDPLKMNITKVSKGDSLESRSNVSRGNMRDISSALQDPLELNITKVRPRNVTAPSQSNIAEDGKRISPALIDPLKLSTTKVNITKDVRLDPVTTAPKVYFGPGTPKVGSPSKTPKVTPKVAFEDNASNAKVTPQKKIPEFKYEIREQENDCNILVLKF